MVETALSIEVDCSRAYTLAKLRGELGSTDAAQFVEALHEFAVGDGARLAIDMRELDSIDSTGLSALIAMVTRSRLGEGRVVLVSPSALVRGVLSVTRLDTWFEICDSHDELEAKFA